MSPTIRLGGERAAIDRAPPAERRAHLHREPATVGGIETRSIWVRGAGVPAILVHGWMDNADTWRAVLERLCIAGRPAIAYDMPGFGAAPALEDGGNVLDAWVEFTAAAVEHAAQRSGTEVVVVGNSLGGWAALRLAERAELPLAGIVPIGPAGINMAPFFFTADRIPIVRRLITLPAPVPEAVVRSIVGRFYRSLAFADPGTIDQKVVDRFSRQNGDRSEVARRIEYVKRVRSELERPFDPEKIEVPVTVLWGDRDHLCMPAGAERLAELLPAARLEMLPGIGHTPQVECPDVVVEAITQLA